MSTKDTYIVMWTIDYQFDGYSFQKGSSMDDATTKFIESVCGPNWGPLRPYGTLTKMIITELNNTYKVPL